MLCKKPFMAGRIPFGCGQCMPCRVKLRRQKMWRQYLESLCHEECCFTTLTYRDEKLPPGGTLVPLDLSLFLKRLRFAVWPTKVRFFGVGEYGDESLRPHYHLTLFGVSGRTDVVSRQVTRHYGAASVIDKAWGLGNTFTAEFNETTAQYVAGYTTKKMTSKTDPRLKGRHPEFARASNRPGLGANAMQIIADQLIKTKSLNQLWKESGDAPHFVMLGRRRIMLDRYLLQKLRLALGMTDEHISVVKELSSEEQGREMYNLLKASLDISPLVTAKKIYDGSVVQPIRNLESRTSIWSKKGSL